MHRALALLIVALAVSRAVPASEAPLKRVAFGSCTREYKPQPLWKAIMTAQPDVWIWLGDIVYGEADNLDDLARRYRTLKEHPDYTALRGQAKVLGIWDDHDYGTTDGGSDNPRKRDVQKLLLDFLDEPADSPRRTQQGVYAAYTFGHAEKEAKIILLDVRFHREPRSRLKQWLGLTTVGEADILGSDQWQWLEQQLTNSSANVHLIGSGTQIIPNEHGYEKWADFPKARQRLLELIAKTKPRNVIFITGDRHFGEISRLHHERLAQPLYELTSSGMTHHAEDHWYWKFSDEPNRHRSGANYLGLNFGVIEFDWEASTAALQIRNVDNAVVREEKITLEPASGARQRSQR